MTNRFSASRSFLLLLLLGWTTIVSAQQAQESFNYGFVSPNTKTDLKLDDAIKGMNSLEEVQLRTKAINLSCVVRSRIRAFKALGSWSDGAEHSVMLRVKSNREPQHAGVELCGVAVEHVVGCPRDGQPIRIRHQLCQAVGHRLDVRR